MKKLIYIILLITGPVIAFAQQDPIFTQNQFNTLTINPAYAGSSEALSLNLIDRMQWVGMEGSPNTLMFSGSTNFTNPHIGIGLYAFRDALGPTVETGLMGSFAYRILFPKSKLSFGVQFGFNYLDIDWNALNPEDQSDPLIINQVSNKAVPDAGVGIYYYSDRFYVGLSSTHLMQNKIVVSTNPVEDKTSFSKLLRHFYAMGGVIVPLSDNLKMRPSALVKYVADAPLQADFNLSFLIYEVLWVGVGYRTENCLNLMAEVIVAKNIHIGYSYDAWFNALKSYNKGSHEIRLGFDFDIFKTERMTSPRYF
jgi:type IX secretion system PorP/SprF family membrane protein